MSGRVGVEQTPDIEAVAAEIRTRAAVGTSGRWILDYGVTPESLAQALAPVLDAAVREARAAELREAADDLTQLAVIEFDARPNAPRGAAIWDSAQWLKDRADRIAVDAPEGGA